MENEYCALKINELVIETTSSSSHIQVLKEIAK